MCRLKEVLAVKSSQKFRVTVAAGIGIVVVYAVWWFFLRPPGPDEVAQMTAQALTRGDVDTLLRLTMPEEVKKLHLTSDGVRGMLSQTLYADGRPQVLKVHLESDLPVDQRQYYLMSAPPRTASVTYPLVIMVTERPNGRWYLALGYVLLNSCGMKDKNMGVDAVWARFWKLGRQYGVKGVRLNTFGYNCRREGCD